LLEAKFDFPVK